MKPTRIFVCDCHPIVLEGLARVLASSPDLELAGTALTPEEALSRLPEAAPDLLLICEEFETHLDARSIVVMKSAAPQARLVLWTTALDSHQGYLQLGFSGVLDKRRSVSELLECLRAVAEGGIWLDGREETPEPVKRRSPPRLTRRERDIVRLVAEGLKNREIAQALSISPGTVKVHLMHIFEKAGVEDRLQLALLARRLLSQEHEEPAWAGAEVAEQLRL